MTETARSLVQAMADAVRREASAREAAANATSEAQEAVRLQVSLHAELRLAGMPLTRAAHVVFLALGQPLDARGRAKAAARYRKRLERGRRTQ